jgi:predicted  nucleic acid-binding Zn-ribbon protein
MYQVGDWYVTGYSFDRDIKNGFKVADFDIYAPPEAPTTPPTKEECKTYITPLEKEIKTLKQLTEDQKLWIEGEKEFRKDLEVENRKLEGEVIKISEERLYWMHEHDKLKQKLEEGRENFIEKIADWVKEMLGKILNKD